MFEITPYFMGLLSSVLCAVVPLIFAVISIVTCGTTLAGIGAEKPELLKKLMVPVIFGAIIAISGVAATLAIVVKMPIITQSGEAANNALTAALIMCGGAIAAGIGISYCGTAMAGAMVEKPETFSKNIIPIILIGIIPIYALLISFTIINQIGGTTAEGAQIMLSAHDIGLIASFGCILVPSVCALFAILKCAGAMHKAGREKPEILTRLVITVVLGEAIAIYGLLVAFMLVAKIPTIATLGGEAASSAIIATLIMCGGAIAAGIGISYCGVGMARSMVEKPETFSGNVVPVVLADALAIYSLLIAFMIIAQIGAAAA